MMTVHNLTQGSDDWHAFRLSKFGASEAAAMLGLSTKVKRNELLHAKHTGLPRLYSEWLQRNILDHGHEVEALARPIVEAMIGAELYPVTCSIGRISASCDGLTMDDALAFEHKQWNEALAAAVASGTVPDEHMPQCQQILLVTGAQKVVFVVSDGTRERMRCVDVLPDQEWFDRIRAGWDQFERDLAAYAPPAAADPAPVGRAPETLPALRIEVTGAVTASNLDAFKETALVAIRGVNRDLKTDGDFADAEKAVKWCSDVEARLAAAKEHALSQTASIDALFRTIDDISAEARRVRLDLDKLVTRRKQEIRDGIVTKARAALADHVRALMSETEGLWVPGPAPDFAGAVKSKRTLASLQDAVDTTLANAKIASDATARDIRAKLAFLRDEASDHGFLFADRLGLVAQPMEAFQIVVRDRIAKHKAAEDDKARARDEAQRAIAAAAATPAPTQQTHAVVAPPQARAAPASAPAEPATLKLGAICERIGVTMTAAFVSDVLGVQPAATDKAAKLFTERQFGLICIALVRHVESVHEAHA